MPLCTPPFSISQNNPKKSMSNQTEPKPKLLLLDSSLRLSLLPLSIACLWVTVAAHQNNAEYGNISFSNFMALKYMAFTTAVAAGYAVLALICSWVRCVLNKAWLFFLSDQVIAYLLVTSGSAVMELAYLAYNGDIQVTWSQACSSYGSFCHSLKIALSLHFLSLFFFLALSLLSAYRAFCLFHPPPIPLTHTHA